MVQFRLMRGDWQIGKENIAINTAPNGQSEHGNRQSAATVNLQKVSLLTSELLIFPAYKNYTGP